MNVCYYKRHGLLAAIELSVDKGFIYEQIAIWIRIVYLRNLKCLVNSAFLSKIKFVLMHPITIPTDGSTSKLEN